MEGQMQAGVPDGETSEVAQPLEEEKWLRAQFFAFSLFHL
jgi:hypothetical protein